MRYHSPHELNLNLPVIESSNLSFEYEMLKSWWFSKKTILDWCQTISNDSLYFILLFSVLSIFPIIHTSINFKRIKFEFFLLPIKIILETILIYFILKISILKILYPIGNYLSNVEISEIFFGIILYFLFSVLFIFLTIFFIFLFLNKFYSLKFIKNLEK
jgi:hypothetical protein